MRSEDHTRERDRLPEGYFLEAGEGNTLVLRRHDGWVVAVFSFISFGPTPEANMRAAEEDYRASRENGA